MGVRAIRDADMATAHSLIEEIRRELDPVEEEIRRHPYLAALTCSATRLNHSVSKRARSSGGTFRSMKMTRSCSARSAGHVAGAHRRRR
jgi:hypothetical protein